MTSTVPSTVIRPRERDALMQSLRAGVVPRAGQRHIQVGREPEVKALVTDIDRIAGGGSAVRFVIGDFGAGKTFFLHLVRSIALEKKLVTVHADLNPDRRLHSSGGQARGLYAELMRNLATRAKPDGGALSSVVERFISTALAEAQQAGTDPAQIIRMRLAHLAELTGGYDFAEVVGAYWRGHDSGDEQLKSSAVRWLRAEYSTKTEARSALGVRTIIDDSTIHDHLKLMSRFVRLAGYDGLLVCLDEMVNLYKLASTQAPQLQLRTDPAHRQRHPARHRRAPGLRLRRHTRIPRRHASGPVQLRGPAVAAGGEQFRCERPCRLLRPGAASGRTDAGGSVRAAGQTASRPGQWRPHSLPAGR